MYNLDGPAFSTASSSSAQIARSTAAAVDPDSSDDRAVFWPSRHALGIRKLDCSSNYVGAKDLPSQSLLDCFI